MRQEFRDVRLDALAEQQEHLEERIGLMTANGEPARAVDMLRTELTDVEQAIRHHMFKGHG
jgi:hypothetical protein